MGNVLNIRRVAVTDLWGFCARCLQCYLGRIVECNVLYGDERRGVADPGALESVNKINVRVSEAQMITGGIRKRKFDHNSRLIDAPCTRNP